MGKPAAPRECGRRACNRVQPGGPARIYAPRPQGAEGSMESNAFYSVRGLLLKSLPVRAEVQAGSACRTLRAQRVLWEAMRLVWAVACVRTAPRRRRELHAGSTRRASPHLCRALLARRVLWEAIHFIMRGDFFGQPRAEGANCMRVQPAARKRVQAQPARRGYV